jgi:prepilin-type N-terminal cleavage/methylation domain-containing protein
VDTIQPTTSNQKAKRAGFSLLEVLVASGILVVGLASVAALLPAAATRMHQAVVQDRAGALAANAYADVMARRGNGILSASNLDGGRLLAFGSTAISNALTNAINVGGGNGVLSTPQDAAKTPSLLFATSGNDFRNQDALQYMPNAGNVPMNIIVNTGPGGAPTERDYKPEICWLATIASSAASPASGSAAALSIAIFKSPDAGCMKFKITGSGVYTVTDSTDQPVSDETRRSYLSGCSYILDTSALPARWCQVTSSWTRSSGTSHITSLILEPSPQGSEVLAFEHLVRVDTHPVHLD